MIEDVDEACVMMSEDEKFLNDDFIKIIHYFYSEVLDFKHINDFNYV